GTDFANWRICRQECAAVNEWQDAYQVKTGEKRTSRSIVGHARQAEHVTVRDLPLVALASRRVIKNERAGRPFVTCQYRGEEKFMSFCRKQAGGFQNRENCIPSL